MKVFQKFVFVAAVCAALCTAAALGLAACASAPVRAAGGAGEPASRTPAGELLWTEPAEVPIWKNNPPKNGEEIYFVGVSRAYDTAADARNAARENAFIQIVQYYGQYIRAAGVEKSSLSGSSGEVLSPYIEREEEITRFAETVVSQVSADRYFTEVYLSAANREEYIVYVLCQIGRERAERDIADFARNTSERYGNLIGTQNTLTGALKACADIMEALANNPLHRALAWYDAPEGRVGLYEYCGLRINALADSVSFEALPAAAIRQGESFTQIIKIDSSMVGEIGSLSCRVGLTGRNNGSPDVLYPLDGNGSFTLVIHTARLEPGNYSVQVELPLNRIAPLVRQNPQAGFPLEIRPARAEILFRGEALSPAEQEVLSRGLQEALQNHHTPFKSGYEFIITLTLQNRNDPVLNTPLLIGEVSVAAAYNGNTAVQSAAKRITESSRDRLIRLSAEYIRNNDDFWTRVGDSIE
jgi:hypothetical protein